MSESLHSFEVKASVHHRPRAKLFHYTEHACLVADPLRASTVKTLWAQVCRSVRKPELHRYSMSVAEVTCERCIRWLDKYRVRGDEAWNSRDRFPVDRMRRVHEECCSKVGAELVIDPADLVEHERFEKLERLSVFTALGAGGMFVFNMRRRLETALSLLTEQEQEALRPATSDYAMAGDLLEEVERLFKRAKTHAEQFTASIGGAS